MQLSRDHRNVTVLALCQALFMTGQSMMFILAGLVGANLSEEKALATLPISAAIIATTLTTIPASLMMKRIGRKPGFLIGALFGMSGALIASYGIQQADFWIFVFGTTTIGMYGGFAQYYRFAAADVAEPNFKGKAISLVISGGIIAAFFGPFLTNYTFDINAIPFLGSFVTLAILAAMAALILTLIDIPRPNIAERSSGGRPLITIVRQPELLAAIFVGVIGYSVMSLLMTATPLAMIAHGYMVHDASFVIQWHLIGMFAPAFFTGSLIVRFGVRKVLLSGTILLIGAIIAALVGKTVGHFWVALFAVGLGWNFTFIGASTLLTETYQPNERAKVQALNDFTVFGTVALASLTSGTILHFFDWRTVNLAAIPPITLAAAIIIFMIISNRRRVA
jgi:MFS family permease